MNPGDRANLDHAIAELAVEGRDAVGALVSCLDMISQGCMNADVLRTVRSSADRFMEEYDSFAQQIERRYINPQTVVIPVTATPDFCGPTETVDRAELAKAIAGLGTTVENLLKGLK